MKLLDNCILQGVDLRTAPGLAQKIKTLYYTAFPKEERIPWWLLRLNARRKGIALTAWMEGETFCGFTSSVTVDGLHFLLFFAVEEGCRGCGYGSRILRTLQAKHGELVLNVETLDPNAPNFSQRKRRFAFYEKNGFQDTGYHVWEVGGKFRVLATTQELNVPLYKKLFRKLTLGLWNVRLEKEK